MTTTTPDIRRVTPASLRRLAELELDGPVLSAFIDLDPERSAIPSARESQLNSLLHAVTDELVEKDGEPRRSVEREIELLRAYIGSDEFPPAGAKGAAVFVAGEELFEVYPLRYPVEPSAQVADRPLYEVIADDVETGRWVVLLVNRRTARLFAGPPDGLREIAEVETRSKASTTKADGRKRGISGPSRRT